MGPGNKSQDWIEASKIIHDPQSVITGHNLKFDLKWAIYKGYIDPDILYHDEKFFDTLMGINVLDENRFNKDLKSLTYDYTDMIEYSMPAPLKTKKKKGEPLPPPVPVDIKETRHYNCQDADSNFRLLEYIDNKLHAQPDLLVPFKIDMRTMLLMTDLELPGLKVDVKELNSMKSNLEKKLEELKAKIPIENVNSPQQVSSMLLGVGVPLPKTDNESEENYSSSEPVLNTLIREGKVPEAGKTMIMDLLNYRKYFKLYSTFALGIEDKLTERNMIHPNYYIAKGDYNKSNKDDQEGGTVTGRLSCKNPNFQQMPRDKDDLEPEFNPRRLFIPRYRYNHSIVSADFSQIEMVIAGIIYKEDKLLEMYETGEDIHTSTAAKAYGVTIDKVTRDMRKFAKAVNFGIVYGISAIGLAARLGCTVEQAEEFIRKYFKVFPDLEAGLDNMKQFAIQNGYVCNYFHRRRRLLGASEYSSTGREQLRQAVNAPVQGTSGDLTKICMWEFFKKFKKLLPKKIGRMIGNVHDEIVFESNNRYFPDLVDLISSVYSYPPFEDYGLSPFPLKLKGDIKRGDNWFEQKEKIKF